MFESIAYIGLGFATAFLSLEAGWHFTACKYKALKPCFYKQIDILSVGHCSTWWHKYVP
ncbi:MAG: hypothetical protein WA364_09090 [Candidatus Nitrosopolaris sp.]